MRGCYQSVLATRSPAGLQVCKIFVDVVHLMEFLVAALIGTERWVQNLTWSGLPKFNKSWRTSLYVAPNSRQVAGYVKSYKQFSFYWILDAGHMVCVICLVVYMLPCGLMQRIIA